MGNNLNIELQNKYVVLLKEKFPKVPDIKDRVFLCQSGFGCSPHTSGRAIYGQFIADGEECRVEGDDVERFATEEEIKQAYKIKNLLEHLQKQSL